MKMMPILWNLIFALILLTTRLNAAVDPEIIAIIESSNNPKAFNAKSNAYGLMQITPICLKHFNQVHGTNHSLNELFDENFNKQVGIWYLDWLSKRCDSDREVLISYNWGYSNRKSKTLPNETKNYLLKYEELKKKRAINN